MKIALIADIHGNFIALQKCLEKIGPLGVDRIFFLGDAVGYFPDDLRVLESLSSMKVDCQKGNHEEMMLSPDDDARRNEQVYRLQDARMRLGGDIAKRIGDWPTSRETTLGGLRFLMVHGSPDHPLLGYVYPDGNLSGYLGLPYDVICMANTHYPFSRRIEDKLFCNPGAVGLPRDQGNLASFAVLDTSSGGATIRRVHLDENEVIRAYGASIHPDVTKCLLRRSAGYVGEVLS